MSQSFFLDCGSSESIDLLHKLPLNTSSVISRFNSFKWNDLLNTLREHCLCMILFFFVSTACYFILAFVIIISLLDNELWRTGPEFYLSVISSAEDSAWPIVVTKKCWLAICVYECVLLIICLCVYTYTYLVQCYTPSWCLTAFWIDGLIVLKIQIRTFRISII